MNVFKKIFLITGFTIAGARADSILQFSADDIILTNLRHAFEQASNTSPVFLAESEVLYHTN